MSCGSCGKNQTVSRPRGEPVEDVHGETGCECVFQEGDTSVFCPRHNVVKSPHQHKLCKHRRDYFQKWEEGRGAGQTPTSNAQIQAGVVQTPEERQKEEEEGEKRRMQIEKSREIPQESRGLGDTIEKITKATGIKAVMDVFTKATGKDCGCEGRREWLNKKLSYRSKTKGFFE
jgi:hypothetical protein